MKIGLVSDTHAWFDPLLPGLFRGAERILHAGDICAESIVEQLEAIAPVAAVRGNCDEGLATARHPAVRVEELGGVRLLLLHDLGRVEKPHAEVLQRIEAERPHVVVSGHSHRGRLDVRDGVLLVNPGSAGRKRFKLLRSAGLLQISSRAIEARLYSLEGERPEEVQRMRVPRR